jgi:CRISPR-associated protein Csx14
MTSTWPVDPRNPAEVLACAGLAHLAWRRDPVTATGFVAEPDGWRFQVEGGGGLLDELGTARLAQADEQALDFGAIRLDWWCQWGLNPTLKTWAGQQTPYSVHRSLVQAAGTTGADSWRTYQAPAGGRLYLDVLGTWNSLGLGWSLNEHGHVQMLARPWAELLASIGLQAFPVRGDKNAGYRYSLWPPLPLVAAVAAQTGYGNGVYALATYHAPTARSGSNTVLRPAEPATDTQPNKGVQA